jgi:hypothetical protein
MLLIVVGMQSLQACPYTGSGTGAPYLAAVTKAAWPDGSTMSRIAAISAALMLSIGSAQAGEASLIAERGGFLVGHGYRCHVGEARLQPAAQLIHTLIAAASDDADAQDAAEQSFAERFLAAVYAAELGGPAASCGSVRAELTRLGRYNSPASAKGQTAMVESRSPAATSAKPEARQQKKTASTRQEPSRKLAAR